MPASIRLSILLVVVAALPFLPLAWMVPALISLTVITLFSPARLRVRIVGAVVRIRWLLLAVAILFIFFTPGPWDDARLLEAFLRCAVLVCAVGAVQLALYGLTPTQMAEGLAAVLRPMRWTGLPTEAFARRLTMTLDAVPRVQALIARTPAPTEGGFVDRLAGRAAAVIRALD